VGFAASNLCVDLFLYFFVAKFSNFAGRILAKGEFIVPTVSFFRGCLA
jgi:hypothetical protein